MRINIGRFLNRKRFALECEVITPMFLGGADQEAKLRAAPFKGMLRYWWRVAQGSATDPEILLQKENAIFGAAGSDDEKGQGKSLVTVEVEPLGGMVPTKENFSYSGEISHREVNRGKTSALGYLAGMGLVRGGIRHSYFKPGGKFKIEISVAESAEQEVLKSLTCWKLFGAIGARSRNGWGCFSMDGLKDMDFPVLAVREWRQALEDSDYPHCFGQDEIGLLCWRTRDSFPSWEKCMHGLAQHYANLRLQFPFEEGEPHKVPKDRHLLGYPVTRHCVERKGWGTFDHKKKKCKPTRHASALRLMVRKGDNGKYRGFFLHLPHAFSRNMWENDHDRQIRIWKKVHDYLDRELDRVDFQGVTKWA